MTLTFIGNSVTYDVVSGDTVGNFAPVQATIGQATGSDPYLYVDVPFGTLQADAITSGVGLGRRRHGRRRRQLDPRRLPALQAHRRRPPEGPDRHGHLHARHLLLRRARGGHRHDGEQDAGHRLLPRHRLQRRQRHRARPELDRRRHAQPERRRRRRPRDAQGTSSWRRWPCPPTSRACSTDGRTARFYLTGTFVAGAVVVSWTGAFEDTAGNTGQADAQSFKLIERLQAPATPPRRPTRSSSSRSRAAWSCAPPASSRRPTRRPASPKPLLSIRGGVSLEVGNRTLTDASGNVVTDANGDPVTRLRFRIAANGTVEVAKIGNIASGAAVFVLEKGNALSDIEFWGVAAFQVNLDFLRAYGIDASGSAVLQINTTDVTHFEQISLEGIPGGVLFSIPTASTSSVQASLPTDTYNPVAAPVALVNFFKTLPSMAGAQITLASGQVVTQEPSGPITLSNAFVQGTVAGQKWKITNGDGKQYFVELTKDSTGASVLLVRGEQRTYQLAPESFSLEVIGAATLYDKPSGGNELGAPRRRPVHPHHAVALRDLRHRRRLDHAARPRRPRQRPADRPGRCQPGSRRPAEHADLGRRRPDLERRRRQQHRRPGVQALVGFVGFGRIVIIGRRWRPSLGSVLALWRRWRWRGDEASWRFGVAASAARRWWRRSWRWWLVASVALSSWRGGGVVGDVARVVAGPLVAWLVRWASWAAS